MNQVVSQYKWFINLNGKSFLTTDEIEKNFYIADNGRLYLKDNKLIEQYFVDVFKDLSIIHEDKTSIT